MVKPKSPYGPTGPFIPAPTPTLPRSGPPAPASPAYPVAQPVPTQNRFMVNGLFDTQKYMSEIDRIRKGLMGMGQKK